MRAEGRLQGVLAFGLVVQAQGGGKEEVGKPGGGSQRSRGLHCYLGGESLIVLVVLVMTRLY